MSTLRTNYVNLKSVTFQDLSRQSSADLGFSQKWLDLVSSRASGVWYQNTTGRPIFVFYKLNTSGGYMYVNTIASDTGMIMVGGANGNSGTWDNGWAVIPNNYFYKTVGSSPRNWSELR